MASQAWKTHERITARYFATERRCRGDDFSKSDVEVLVNTKEWLKDLNTELYPVGPLEGYLIVECKYNQRHGIVTLFKDLASNSLKVPLLQIDDYLLCYLNDFKEVYTDFIDECSEITPLGIVEKYRILETNRKAPKYLEDYRVQAMDYIPDLVRDSPCLPITCLAKGSTKGRIISVRIKDIEKFKQTV